MAYDKYDEITAFGKSAITAINDAFKYLYKKIQGGIGVRQIDQELTSVINSKATVDSVDDITGQIAELSTEITQNATAITLKADRTYVDGQDGTLSNEVATATTTANTAKAYTDALASDSTITPDEKLSLWQQWGLITAEATATTGKIPAQAIAFGVSHTSFDAAFTALSTYLTSTLNLFASMTTATAGIDRPTWDAKWQAYYNARTDLLNAIAGKAKALADAAQASASEALLELAPDQIRLKVGQIGGSNLIQNSGNFSDTSNWIVTMDGASTLAAPLSIQAGGPGTGGRKPTLVYVKTGTYAAGGYIYLDNTSLQSVKFVSGKKYTLSGSIYTDTAGNYSIWIADFGGGNMVQGFALNLVVGYNSFAIPFAAAVAGNQPRLTFVLNKSNVAFVVDYVKLEEGENATAWSNSQKELLNSAITITDKNVGIDTQNFNLTLRDNSNNPALVIDATAKGFVTNGQWAGSPASWTLSGYQLIGNYMGQTGMIVMPTAIKFKNNRIATDPDVFQLAHYGDTGGVCEVDFYLHSGAQKMKHGFWGGIDYMTMFNPSNLPASGCPIEVYQNAWFAGNVSALSFTDRTPWPEGIDALEAIAGIKGDGNGSIDHSTLPDFARRQINSSEDAEQTVNSAAGGQTMALDTDVASGADASVDQSEDGRDLGAMISLLTVAVQQLAARVEALEGEKAS